MSAKKRPPKRVRQTQAQIKRYDDVIRQQVYLERLKAALISDFDKAILEVESNITSLLGRFKEPNLGDLNRTELNRLLSEMRKIEADGYGAQIERLSIQLSEISNYSAKLEAAQLTNWAAKAAEAAKISTPSVTSVWSFVQNQPIAATGQLVGDFLIDYKDKAISRMEGAVRNGWAQGKTTADMIREFRGTKAKNFKDGLLRGADKRAAEAIVRTSVQHVANTARLKTWEDNSDLVKGYMWVSTLDSLTTTTCRSLDRQKFKLNQGPVPPIHVNCRSTTIADLGEEWDWLDKGATRSSEFGYVPAGKSYYEWLKTQDEEFIKDAIGPKRAELFMKGGLSADEFASLNLGKNFEPLTLAEMQKRDAAAFKRAGVDLGRKEQSRSNKSFTTLDRESYNQLPRHRGSQAQDNAVRQYTGVVSRYLNEYLRKGDVSDPDFNEIAGNLRDWFRTAPPLPVGVKVSRVTSARVGKMLIPGEEFQDMGFTSTTAFGEKFIKGDHHIEILVPEGSTRVAAVQHLTDTFGENEILFDAGARFKVISSSGDKTIMEFVGHGPLQMPTKYTETRK